MSSFVGSAQCGIDWSYTYHNEDGDFCRNIAIQIDGLSGDCENCRVVRYSNDLEGPIFQKIAWLNTDPSLDPLDPVYSLTSADPVLPSGIFYYGPITRFTGGSLNGPQFVDFDYWVGSASNVQLCVSAIIQCSGSGEQTVQSCDLVDLLCW